jgi:hypothetical protein
MVYEYYQVFIGFLLTEKRINGPSKPLQSRVGR